MRKHIFYWVTLAILLPLFAYATTPYIIRNNSDMTGPPVIGHTTANTAYFSNTHTTNLNVTTVLATTIRTNGLVVNGPINANGGLTAGVINAGVLNVTTFTNTNGTFTTLTATTANLTGISTVGMLAQSIQTAGLKIRGVESPYHVFDDFVGSGANTITLNPNPGITAYAGGQTFHFTAKAANTTSVTVNVNGLGAKSVKKVIYDSTLSELHASDILTGEIVSIIYNAVQGCFIITSQHTTQDHPFGEFYFENNAQATTLSSAGVWFPVGGNGVANTVNHSFSVARAVSGTIMTYTGTRTQTAHMAVTATAQSTAANETIYVSLYRNGILQPNGVTSTKITTSGDRQSLILHIMTSLAPNDTFQVYAKNDEANNIIVVDLNLFVMGVYN